MSTIYIPPCSPGLGKPAAPADTILADNLGFRESVDLPELPYLQQFLLAVYNVENLVTPTTGMVAEVTNFNPQLLLLTGVDDTTAYARNPDGFHTGEAVMLHDLPVLTANPGEVRAVFVHGVTDAPTINVVATNGDTLMRGLHYSAVSAPISIAPGNYTVDLVRRHDRQKLGTYSFDVNNHANGYVALTLSGFLDPAANQNGLAMELGVYDIPLDQTTSIGERDEAAPQSLQLLQNYPNPFNPVTSIRYAVDRDQLVSVKVYDALGNEVAILVNERKPAGTHRVSFDATGIASGIYFCQMKAEEFVSTRKMLFVQ
jgi:hypothetical protein